MTLQLSMSLRRKIKVTIEPKLFEKKSELLADFLRGRQTLLVTTPTVDRLHGAKVRAFIDERHLTASVEVLSLSEERKTLDVVAELCSLSIDRRLGRNDILLALGGGVCSDLVGLSAALIRRGVRHVRVPTTLVGQIDAGIGIKSGANFRNRKNYVGAYHPPTAVYVDPYFLETLDLGRIRQGLSEIVKIALIRDRGLFEEIEKHAHELLHSRFQAPARIARYVIRRSIELMLEQLSENPLETSTKRLVDMGHTFSPTLEEESGFSIPHGEAVAIDMAFSCLLAEDLGLLSGGDGRRVIHLLRRVGLPVSSPLLTVELCKIAIKNAIAHRAGNLNLVMPARIGEGVFLESATSLTTERLARVLGSTLKEVSSPIADSAVTLWRRPENEERQAAKEAKLA